MQIDVGVLISSLTFPAHRKMARQAAFSSACLKSASAILSQLASSKAKLVPALQAHRKSLPKKLSPRLRESLKDNNDIYHNRRGLAARDSTTGWL